MTEELKKVKLVSHNGKSSWKEIANYARDKFEIEDLLNSDHFSWFKDMMQFDPSKIDNYLTLISNAEYGMGTDPTASKSGARADNYFDPIKGATERVKVSHDNGTSALNGITNVAIPTLLAYGAVTNPVGTAEAVLGGLGTMAVGDKIATGLTGKNSTQLWRDLTGMSNWGATMTNPLMLLGGKKGSQLVTSKAGKMPNLLELFSGKSKYDPITTIGDNLTGKSTITDDLGNIYASIKNRLFRPSAEVVSDATPATSSIEALPISSARELGGYRPRLATHAEEPAPYMSFASIGEGDNISLADIQRADATAVAGPKPEAQSIPGLPTMPAPVQMPTTRPATLDPAIVRAWIEDYTRNSAGVSAELDPFLRSQGLGSAARVFGSVAASLNTSANNARNGLMRAFRNYEILPDGSFGGLVTPAIRDPKNGGVQTPGSEIYYTFIPQQAGSNTGTMTLFRRYGSRQTIGNPFTIDLSTLPLAQVQYRIGEPRNRTAQVLHAIISGFGGNPGLEQRLIDMANAAPSVSPSHTASTGNIPSATSTGLGRSALSTEDLLPLLREAQYEGETLYDPVTGTTKHYPRGINGHPYPYYVDEAAKALINGDMQDSELTDSQLADIAASLYTDDDGARLRTIKLSPELNKAFLQLLANRFGVVIPKNANTIWDIPKLITAINKANFLLKRDGNIRGFGAQWESNGLSRSATIPALPQDYDLTVNPRVEYARVDPETWEILRDDNGRVIIDKKLRATTPVTLLHVFGTDKGAISAIIRNMGLVDEAAVPGSSISEASTSTHSYPFIARSAIEHPDRWMPVRTDDGKIVLTLMNTITYGGSFNGFKAISGIEDAAFNAKAGATGDFLTDFDAALQTTFDNRYTRENLKAIKSGLRNGIISPEAEDLWYSDKLDKSDNRSVKLTTLQLSDIIREAESEGIPVNFAIELESVLSGPKKVFTPMDANIQQLALENMKMGMPKYKAYFEAFKARIRVEDRLPKLKLDIKAIIDKKLSTEDKTRYPIIGGLDEAFYPYLGHIYRPLLVNLKKQGGKINYFKHFK